MTETRINTYEGMFLFSLAAASDLDAAVNHVKEILARADAEIISFSKWDERRLAYEIRGNKRGIYFLTYFKANAAKMSVVERTCNLSEQFLRWMILRADQITSEQIEASDGRARIADEAALRGVGSEATASAGSSLTE